MYKLSADEASTGLLAISYRAYSTLLVLSCNAMFVLQWNPVEKEWDCPCHGSCFDKKGKQLAGPATTDMRPPQIVTD